MSEQEKPLSEFEIRELEQKLLMEGGISEELAFYSAFIKED